MGYYYVTFENFPGGKLKTFLNYERFWNIEMPEGAFSGVFFKFISFVLEINEYIYISGVQKLKIAESNSHVQNVITIPF